MKILLLGKDGQVGWELQRSLALLGEVISINRQSQCCGDLTDLDGIARTVRAIAPDVIVNAAAYTAVDEAENEPELARTINALAPGVLAAEAKRKNSWLIHYSTDYVFDGSGSEPWAETAIPAPLNVYGQTKLEGDQLIQQVGGKYLIFRTSWVYGARGDNFVKKILKLGQSQEQIKVVDDQVGSPTGADWIADMTSHAIARVFDNPDLAGLYHVAAAGETSWHGCARSVLKFAQSAGVCLKTTPDKLQAVSSSSFRSIARRPLNSRLATQKFQNVFDLHPIDWESGVIRMLTEVLEK